MVSKSRTPDLRMLRIFVAVARENGVTAAAQALGITKSSVSKQLDGLEHALQVRLFERTSRRLLLTHEGQMLRSRAESILADLEQLVTDAQEVATGVQGTVRVAASPEFGAFLSERFFPLLLARHPALKVVLSLDYRLDNLHDPSIDVAFRLGPIGDDRLISRPVAHFARVLVCSPAYWQQHAIETPEQLSRVNALLFDEQVPQAHWTLQLIADPTTRCTVEVNGNFAVQGFTALERAAVAGMGIAQLPSFVAWPAVAGKRLVQVLPQWQSPPVVVQLAYRPGIGKVGRVRTVIEEALRLVPDLLNPQA